MNAALELASAEFIEAHELRCPDCGSSRVTLALPPEVRPWSEGRIKQEVGRAPILCLDRCKRETSEPEPASGPFVVEKRPAILLATKAIIANSEPGAAAVTAYLAGMKSRASKRGMFDALKILSRLLGQEDPNAIAWHRLGYADTSAMQAQLVESGRTPDYCRKLITGLRGVLKASKKLRLMSADAYELAVDLERIRGSRVRNVKDLSVGDLEKLLAATRSDRKRMRALRDRALLALLAGGGLRREEAAIITIDRFDGRRLVVLGKGDKERHVPLPEWSSWAIAIYVEARGFFEGSLVNPVSQRGVVIRKAITGGQGIYVQARRIWRRAGLPPIGCHAFRRDYCQRVLDSGADLALAQQLLGHSSPTTTSLYARRTVARLTIATDRLADPEATA